MSNSYLSVVEVSELWNLSVRRVQILCSSGRVEGAHKVGNQWRIPIHACKPRDKREKKKLSPNDQDRKRELKKLCVELVDEFSQKMNINEVLDSVISTFYIEYIRYVNLDHTIFQNDLKESFQYCGAFDKNEKVYAYLLKYRELPQDDTISWVFQYVNKHINTDKSNISNTQFFTENYITNFLIRKLNLVTSDIIFDPACGGGNFLLSAAKTLIEKSHIETIDDLSKIQNNIIGYDIDNYLAKIAYLNLRIFFYKVAFEMGFNTDLNSFFPRIYVSKEKNILGSLSLDNHKIHSIHNPECITMRDLYNTITVVVTNPPFLTSKGMTNTLSGELKNFFPLSNSDICNSFIELLIRELPQGSRCGMVTQNSWLYLSSFKKLKHTVFKSVMVDEITELGSDAFLDLNGEKANVLLLMFVKKNSTETYNYINLSNKNHKELVATLNNNTINYSKVTNVRSASPRLSSNFNNHFLQHEKFSNYGIAMQGTSTGDNKNLVDYFWNRISDKRWKKVSKGGGYSRWYGLNSYVVKWGNDAEYIKMNEGHALRNIQHMNKTNAVFSDTGTSGLSVRYSESEELFIASGPGIRVNNNTNIYNVIGYLNSRYASYIIRSISPKLTISAGYINRLPVKKEIFDSELIRENAKQAIGIKKIHAEKRVIFNNFKGVRKKSGSLSLFLKKVFIEDLDKELDKLIIEDSINREVYRIMEVSDSQTVEINKILGDYIFDYPTSLENKDVNLDVILVKLLDSNLNLRRTKHTLSSQGSDGVLEYLSYELKMNPIAVLNLIRKKWSELSGVKKLVKNFVFHTFIMHELNYPNELNEKVDLKIILNTLYKRNNFKHEDIEIFEEWLDNDFNTVHTESFLNNPIYYYDIQNKELKRKIN
ncbi:N-6 DNA methylase [Erysipelothrix rhusiopathiae]|nr:N-6 DNA methylase [Erysipelothrix rhusiopathiae]